MLYLPTFMRDFALSTGSSTPTRPMLEATVKALEAIVKAADLREAFVTSMMQHTCFSGSLIRLITSALLRPKLEDLPAASTLARVAEVVLQENNLKKRPAASTKDISHPVCKLFEDFLAKRGAKVKPNQGNVKQHQQQLQDKSTFEKSIKVQVENALKKKETKPLIESMAQMLIKEGKQNANKNGLIIDWLQKVDPELQGLTTKLRQDLLFKNNPHLLTVFSHLANWNHLKATVDGVLKAETDHHKASSVLDFLATCTFLKMQW